MSPLINLLLLFAIVAFCMIAWRYWQQRADEKLRNNPPQRRIIEVSLPVGVADSAMSMARFYRKAAAAALGDKGARRVGARQIDFVYLVDVPAEGALPRLKCRIYADPDKMDAVKKALKSSFHDAIDVLEMKEDDLLPLAKILRPEEDSTPEESDAEFAPEDIRALLEEGGEVYEVDAEVQKDIGREKTGISDKGKKDREEDSGDVGLALDAFSESGDGNESGDGDNEEAGAVPKAGGAQKEEQREEGAAKGVAESTGEDILGEEIDDKPPPPRPQKQGGVQTIDFIIGEEENDET